MESNNILSRWWNTFTRRVRLSMFNTRDNSELWHTYISPINLITATVAMIVLIFIVVLTLVGYTPILESLPGYSHESAKMRNEMIDNILRLDSMERVIDDIMLYNQNVALIMSGKTPISAEEISLDTENRSKALVVPNLFDSILRHDIEEGRRYSLTSATNTMMLTPMIAPANGEITKSFDIAEEQYGISMSVAAGERVLAVQSGIVILAIWTPTEDYIVQILHPDNMISIYQNITDIMVKRGDNIDAGGVVGYNGARDSSPNKIIKFELWDNNKPVDPEKYIVF